MPGKSPSSQMAVVHGQTDMQSVCMAQAYHACRLRWELPALGYVPAGRVTSRLLSKYVGLPFPRAGHQLHSRPAHGQHEVT